MNESLLKLTLTTFYTQLLQPNFSR